MQALEDEATKLVANIEGGREDKAALVTKLLTVEQQVGGACLSAATNCCSASIEGHPCLPPQ